MKVIEDYKSLKIAKRKLYVGRKGKCGLKRVHSTITKIKNEIVSIVEKFCNGIYKSEDQRESISSD